MKEKIATKLRGLLVNHVDVGTKVEDISETISLYEDGLCLDSVEVIDFIAEVEKEFAIQFSDDELRPDTFKDIRTLSQIVAQKVVSDSERVT
jgi:acyl carrier protein